MVHGKGKGDRTSRSLARFSLRLDEDRYIKCIGAELLPRHADEARNRDIACTLGLVRVCAPPSDKIAAREHRDSRGGQSKEEH